MNICTCVLYHEVLVCMAFRQTRFIGTTRVARIRGATSAGAPSIRIHVASLPLGESRSARLFRTSAFRAPFLLLTPFSRLVAAVSFSRKDVVTELIVNFSYSQRYRECAR